jgi:hypothetical protein
MRIELEAIGSHAGYSGRLSPGGAVGTGLRVGRVPSPARHELRDEYDNSRGEGTPPTLGKLPQGGLVLNVGACLQAIRMFVRRRTS